MQLELFTVYIRLGASPAQLRDRERRKQRLALIRKRVEARRAMVLPC